jgi:hypothetical protein
VDFLVRLTAAFRKHAQISTVTGLNPYHFANYRDASFTHYLRNGENLTHDLGISLWELLLLERVCGAHKPKSILIIGNGMGWSAIAMAMMNPSASVVVIEPHTGIELTNQIAAAEQLQCRVVQGWSPNDCARIIREHCPVPPDFVLIDGLHTSRQIALDFQAVFAISGRNALYFFHDIINFDLFDGLEEIEGTTRLQGMRIDILFCTPSGMAVIAPEEAPEAVRSVIQLFSPKSEDVAVIARRGGTVMPQVWGRFDRP